MPKLQWLTVFPAHRTHTHTLHADVRWEQVSLEIEMESFEKDFRSSKKYGFDANILQSFFLFMVYFTDICSSWAVLPGWLGQDFLLYSRGAHSIIQILLTDTFDPQLPKSIPTMQLFSHPDPQIHTWDVGPDVTLHASAHKNYFPLLLFYTPPLSTRGKPSLMRH